IALVLNEARAVCASSQPSDGVNVVARVGAVDGTSVGCHVIPPSCVTSTPCLRWSEKAIAIVSADAAAIGPSQPGVTLGTGRRGPNVLPRSVEICTAPESAVTGMQSTTNTPRGAAEASAVR